MKKMHLLTALCLCGAFYLLYLLIEGKRSGDDYAFFIFILLLFPFSLNLFLDYYQLSSKERNFPIFVRDLAFNVKTGMEPVRAIILLKDNDYGALSGEVKLLASNLKLGVSVDKALESTIGNTKSKRIKRSISIISGSMRAGGEFDKMLMILSAYLTRDREIKSEIKSELFTYQLIFYIVFIIFISINYFLLKNILPMMNTSGFSVDVNFYETLMFRTTLLLGVSMGIVGGKLAKGSIAGGLPDAFLLSIIGYVLNKILY